MPMTIGANINLLRAQRRLDEGSKQLSKTFQSLSSGQRISSSSDDAAGLAISESLKSNRRVLNQGVRNFNDGVSLLNIADGAIQSLSNIVIRLKELAEQAANGTYSFAQRKSMDKEAQALSKEYTRISQSTSFNGIGIFDGSLGNGLRVQGGFGVNGGVKSTLGGALSTGTFASANTFGNETLAQYSEVATGDLNGDGMVDLVISGYGTIDVRMGNGSGEFGTAMSYTLSSASGSLALGDVNGDGILDIASGGSGIFNDILIGRSNGTFNSPTSFLGVGGINDGTLADLNNDGKLDLINSYSAGVAVNLGNGNGTFASAITYQMDTAGSLGIAVGDLNADGNLDVVTVGTNGNQGTSMVRLGLGNGTLGASTSYQLIPDDSAFGNSFTEDVVLGDLNGDAILDLVAAGYHASTLPNPRGLVVQLGNGDGTFGAVTSIGVTIPLLNNSLTLGDLNGDGQKDILLTAYSAGTVAEIFIGSGNGSFSRITSNNLNTSLERTMASTLGDLNDDGVQDLIMVGDDNVSASKVSTLTSNTKDGISSLLDFSLNSQSNAQQAISQFDRALVRLSVQQGKIGAFQSRLGVGASVLRSSAENYAAAESRIQDSDVASDAANLTRLNILQQVASSVIAHGSLQSKLVLKLLDNS